MAKKYAVVDYRSLRPNNLFSKKFRHLLLLLYWPIFLVLFEILEHVHEPAKWNVMYVPFDDMIPFNELFVIPYLMWFVFMAGMVVYLMFFDVEGFKKYMWSVIVVYTISLIFFYVYPTSQELRPAVFERDNILTRFMYHFYQFDTNTNVCPSLHVVGALMVVSASWHTERFKPMKWKIAFTVVGCLISISTVFLKQHSIIDVIVGVGVAVVSYIMCYVVAEKIGAAMRGRKSDAHPVKMKTKTETLSA